MDAKTGSVASDDVFRVARPKHHSYEQVFTTFTTTPQSRFIQSIAPAQDEPLLKQEDDDEDKMSAPQGQQKQPQEQQQQRSGSSRSPLFWVNSDPQTVQKGSREQTLKRIRSHVMSEHNRKKRLENTRRYNKSKTWKNLAYRPEPIASSQLSRTVESSISSPSSSSTSDRSSSKSSSSPEIRERSPPNSLKTSRSSSSIKSETSISFSSLQIPTPEALHDQQLSVVSSHEQSSVPKILYSGTEEVDPFHAMQVRLSEAQYQHFKFFLYDLVPQASPFIKHGVEYLRSHWVSLAQSNPAVLYACITSAITNKSLLTGDFFADQATQRKNPLMLDRLRNRGETISLINQNLSSLSSAASDASIAAVAMLISVEVTGSNPQDIAPHLNGLRKMVSLRKNFGDISKWIRLQIEWNDIRSACKTMSKPLFPFIRYTMPPRAPPQVSVENAGKLASALRLLSHIPGVFGVEMCRTIDDLTSLTLYAEIFKFQPKLAAVLFDEEIEEYFNNEVLYTEYCLVNDRWVYHTAPTLSNGTAFSPMADSASSSRTSGFRLRGDDTIEGAVRLACLLFHNTTIWPFYPAVGPLFPLPIFALETALRNGIAMGTYTYLSDLLIWLLFVGASASKYLPTSQMWFLDELRKAVGQYNTSVISSLNPSANTTFQNNVSLDHHHQQQQQQQSPPPPTAPALASIEDFRDVLSGFFYTDRFYMANVSEIWTTLTQSGS